MIEILIADDHAILCRGLRETIEEHADMRVVGEAHDGRAALDLARSHPWDVLVLDIGLPGIDGLSVLGQLRDGRQRLPVLVLTMHPEEQFAIRSLRAGAAGYLTKESASEELVRAIRRIHAGGLYVSQSLVERMALTLENPDRLPHETLSDREFEVLCKIASGRTVSQIAGDLVLSVTTISTYRARVLEKMGMKTNAELTHYAIRNGLVE